MDEWDHAWTKWIPVLEKELINEMEKAPAVSEVHAMDHILRVRDRCERLGKELNADPEVLVAAVYLHDLGRHYIPDTAHGTLSAQKAEPVLSKIQFPVEKMEKVLHAIRVHDVSSSPDGRTTIESKILYDADKIDTLGVIGILRYIRHYYGKESIDYMLDDIERRWQGLALPETRRLASEEYEYITNYFLQLKKQLRK